MLPPAWSLKFFNYHDSSKAPSKLLGFYQCHNKFNWYFSSKPLSPPSWPVTLHVVLSTHSCSVTNQLPSCTESCEKPQKYHTACSVTKCIAGDRLTVLCNDITIRGVSHTPCNYTESCVHVKFCLLICRISGTWKIL